MLVASVPNMETVVEQEWLARIRAGDPSAELELQTAVALKDAGFGLRSNPSALLSIFTHLALTGLFCLLVCLLARLPVCFFLIVSPRLGFRGLGDCESGLLGLNFLHVARNCLFLLGM